MFENSVVNPPVEYEALVQESNALNFSQCSDWSTASILRTLVSSKPGGRILELGTGTGLALSWILSGADAQSSVISIDNDPALIDLAKTFFAKDSRLELICQDGNAWIKSYKGEPFDLIFADAWPGKFDLLEETLELLVDGGIYIIDDLLQQPNWPEGHKEKVEALIKKLETNEKLNLTKLNWSTGLIIATKRDI